jgi:cytochrome c556
VHLDLRIALLASTLGAALGACQAGGAASDRGSPRAMPRPERLPAAARALLDQRMQRHGAAMSDMLWATLFLDHDSAREIAVEIASEPRLARPFERDATQLNALMPERFFELQDELVANAEALAKVAETRDADGLAEAMARLTSTCIRCHSAYLGEPAAEPQPAATP